MTEHTPRTVIPKVACAHCGQARPVRYTYESTRLAPGETVVVVDMEHNCPRTVDMRP